MLTQPGLAMAACSPHADGGRLTHLVKVVIESLWGSKGGGERCQGSGCSPKIQEATSQGRLSSEDRKPAATPPSEARGPGGGRRGMRLVCFG